MARLSNERGVALRELFHQVNQICYCGRDVTVAAAAVAATATLPLPTRRCSFAIHRSQNYVRLSIFISDDDKRSGTCQPVIIEG